MKKKCYRNFNIPNCPQRYSEKYLNASPGTPDTEGFRRFKKLKKAVTERRLTDAHRVADLCEIAECLASESALLESSGVENLVQFLAAVQFRILKLPRPPDKKEPQTLIIQGVRGFHFVHY